MQYFILRETPDNSGTYTATGQEHEGSAEGAIELAAELAQKGGRYAVQVYDPIRAIPGVAPTHPTLPASGAVEVQPVHPVA